MNKSTKVFFSFALTMLATCFVILMLAFDGQARDNNEVAKVYRKALELNKGRFADPNLIFIGDTVLFPAHSGSGIEAYVAESPTDGKHDSFWRLSERYVNRQIITFPADTMQVRVHVPTTPKPEVTEAKTGMRLYEWLLTALLLIGIILLLKHFWKDVIKPSPNPRPVNPDHFQPVGGNIDALPREEALRSVMMRYLLPGETLINFRSGTLGNRLGQSRIEVDMQFGDNVRRQAWLNSGERVSTAIIQEANGNRRTQHLRNACSNGFGGSSFELPSGWFITYDVSEEAGRVTTEDNGQGDQPLVVPTPAPAPSNFKSLMKAIKNLDVREGYTAEISFKENQDGIDLSIKINENVKKRK